ncbi:MAG: TIGR02391 family protein [candidate division Zixibacteria bacterium]|nr:TIGR02391 family protein [candidate division Zixibacteria bacterium]
MNLETNIQERLWAAIQTNHENRNYTGAILDAMHFLGNLLREKTEIEDDGVSLVGQAFGGKSPKLKVNKLQSESDKNIQKGVEQILRGLYQAIRNPRSHEKYQDDVQDAYSIILFVDFIVRIIDQSKTPFMKSDFMKRVLDPDFAESERYAELLVGEIPPKQRLDIFIDVFRQKEQGKGRKLQYFFPALLSILKDDEKKEVYHIVSSEMKETNSTDAIRLILHTLPRECWPHYEEIARLRIENKLLKEIEGGKYNDSRDRCQSGSLGTWAAQVAEHFSLKDELISLLTTKLESGDVTQQAYVLKFFFSDMTKWLEAPTKHLERVIVQALEDGSRRFHKALSLIMYFGDEMWQKPFQKAYEEFQEAEPTLEIGDEDDLPF